MVREGLDKAVVLISAVCPDLVEATTSDSVSAVIVDLVPEWHAGPCTRTYICGKGAVMPSTVPQRQEERTITRNPNSTEGP